MAETLGCTPLPDETTARPWLIRRFDTIANWRRLTLFPCLLELSDRTLLEKRA
jgi:hypothetical protein